MRVYMRTCLHIDICLYMYLQYGCINYMCMRSLGISELLCGYSDSSFIKLYRNRKATLILEANINFVFSVLDWN